MEIDRNGLEVLDESACLRLLATATIGRLALTTGALPVVLPVNFMLTDRGVVFRTSWGAKLEAATRGTVVALEADAIDVVAHSGWSVVVTGTACELRDPADVAWARALPLAHWGAGDVDRYVLVPTTVVTGRRLDPTDAAGRRVAQRRGTGTRHDTTVPPSADAPSSKVPPNRSAR